MLEPMTVLAAIGLICSGGACLAWTKTTRADAALAELLATRDDRTDA